MRGGSDDVGTETVANDRRIRLRGVSCQGRCVHEPRGRAGSFARA
jgi:hypothetical protein